MSKRAVVPTTVEQPSRFRTMWWGFTRRCPRCGSGHLFRQWFHIVDDCPRCGLHFEREAGYWIGAMAVNLVFTMVVFAIGLIIAVALTVPDIPVAPLLAFFVPVMVLLPIAFYPFSKTVWMAIDRAILQRMDPKERLDEQARHI